MIVKIEWTNSAPQEAIEKLVSDITTWGLTPENMIHHTTSVDDSYDDGPCVTLDVDKDRTKFIATYHEVAQWVQLPGNCEVCVG